jgi:hypothetical protein
MGAARRSPFARPVTIRHLLTHRSGLPAGRDIWRIADSPWEAREAVIASALMPGCPPGACYEYSDLGPDILGFVGQSGQQSFIVVPNVNNYLVGIGHSEGFTYNVDANGPVTISRQ